MRCSKVCRTQSPMYLANTSDILLAAFENFLGEFKTSPEQQITTALGNIDIDADDLSDEYDFLDDDDDAQNRRVREKAPSRMPQHKYKDWLQKLSDRKVDEIVIDLDDLANVRWPSLGYNFLPCG